MDTPAQPCSLPTTVSLEQIAAWQLQLEESCDFRVELPKLQRGFVWEPAKIMDLWDSLLRGFPIGSMMVSTIDPEPTEEGNSAQHYWLLDGQQRATSIALGFYDPWTADQNDPKMWNLKVAPTLWLDLEREHQDGDTKVFFPYLVTQSHPWGYNKDGGVISWGKRVEASNEMGLGENYFHAELKSCFPWEAALPFPVPFLITAAQRSGTSADDGFWEELQKLAELLPEAWRARYSEKMVKGIPKGLERLLPQIRQLKSTRVHINFLTKAAEENDTNDADDTSLLFVRMNAGGTVLGGEELIFSLFKSTFPLAKDAVEKCAAGFMAPSKLFGLFVRLAASQEGAARLSRPMRLKDFRREIRSSRSTLKIQLQKLLEVNESQDKCEAARLFHEARRYLCGPKEEACDFCMPEAAATRSINESPGVFLALLYWLKKGGVVRIGSEAHRRLLGCFTMLAWFEPGNAKARQESLRTWVSSAENDPVSSLWSPECLHYFFTREERTVPFFPQPSELLDVMMKGTFDAAKYTYENIPNEASPAFWEDYNFIPGPSAETGELREQQLHSNFFTLLNKLWPNRTLLIYAQRKYIREKFQGFGQWEMTLKDTHCPWDWDHIYPSAYHRKNPQQPYKDWHNAIGNLRAIGLSENRSDGADWPSEKLTGRTADEGIK